MSIDSGNIFFSKFHIQILYDMTKSIHHIIDSILMKIFFFILDDLINQPHKSKSLLIPPSLWKNDQIDRHRFSPPIFHRAFALLRWCCCCTRASARAACRRTALHARTAQQIYFRCAQQQRRRHRRHRLRASNWRWWILKISQKWKNKPKSEDIKPKKEN